jgi:hypothetical protein
MLSYWSYSPFGRYNGSRFMQEDKEHGYNILKRTGAIRAFNGPIFNEFKKILDQK